MTIADNLRLVNLDLAEIRVRQRGGAEPILEWYVAYAPEPEVELGGRVVFATIHAHGPRGGGEVTAAAIVLYPQGDELTSEEFEGVLLESDALETLYDHVRGAARIALTMVEADVDLPRKAPIPKLSQLERVAEGDEAEPSEQKPSQRSHRTR